MGAPLSKPWFCPSTYAWRICSSSTPGHGHQVEFPSGFDGDKAEKLMMPVDVFRKLSHLGVRAHMGDLPSQHQSPTVGFSVAFRALQLPLSEVKVEQERKQTSCCLGKGLLSVLLTENPSTIGRKVVPSVKVPCGNLSLRSSILRQKECWKAPIQSCRKSNPYFLFCV